MGEISVETALKQVLWHYRHINPDMSVKVMEKDEQALAECSAYLKAEAKVTIVQRPGCFIVALTDASGNAIVPVENNQADYDLGEKARNRKRIAEEGEMLANRCKNMAAQGEFSSSAVTELADTVLALIK